MFNENSTLAWVIIIGLALFILALNFGLLWGMKQKVKKENWMSKVNEAGHIMRHPLKKEFDQLEALSEQVSKIHQTGNAPAVEKSPTTDKKESE